MPRSHNQQRSEQSPAPVCQTPRPCPEPLSVLAELYFSLLSGEGQAEARWALDWPLDWPLTGGGCSFRGERWEPHCSEASPVHRAGGGSWAAMGSPTPARGWGGDLHARTPAWCPVPGAWCPVPGAWCPVTHGASRHQLSLHPRPPPRVQPAGQGLCVANSSAVKTDEDVSGRECWPHSRSHGSRAEVIQGSLQFQGPNHSLPPLWSATLSQLHCPLPSLRLPSWYLLLWPNA